MGLEIAEGGVVSVIKLKSRRLTCQNTFDSKISIYINKKYLTFTMIKLIQVGTLQSVPSLSHFKVLIAMIVIQPVILNICEKISTPQSKKSHDQYTTEHFQLVKIELQFETTIERFSIVACSKRILMSSQNESNLDLGAAKPSSSQIA